MTQTDPTSRPFGVVIMAGGRSRRMGRDKRFLPWGEGERGTLLEWVLSRMSGLSDRLVISCSADDTTMLTNRLGEHGLGEHWRNRVVLAVDAQPDLGPKEGLRMGLAACRALGCDRAFVTSCDSPWVNPEWVRYLDQQLESYDAVMPTASGKIYGLTAIYRTNVIEPIAQSMAAGDYSIKGLAETLNTKLIDADSLRHLDPRGDCFVNLNTPDDYDQALRRWKIIDD